MAKCGGGDDYDVLLRMIVIGDSGVGKSCMLLRFVDNTFTSSFIATVGVDFRVRTIQLDGRTIKLQLWDTSGAERFRNITASYYRGAQGVVVVYDVTSAESFANVRSWLRDVERFADDRAVKLLVGNKSDLALLRQVSAEDAQTFADAHGMQLLETSAKQGASVDAAFSSLVTAIRQKQHHATRATTTHAGAAQLRHSVDITAPDTAARPSCCS